MLTTRGTLLRVGEWVQESGLPTPFSENHSRFAIHDFRPAGPVGVTSGKSRKASTQRAPRKNREHGGESTPCGRLSGNVRSRGTEDAEEKREDTEKTEELRREGREEDRSTRRGIFSGSRACARDPERNSSGFPSVSSVMRSFRFSREGARVARLGFSFASFAFTALWVLLPR
jgi:hypothetical protein